MQRRVLLTLGVILFAVNGFAAVKKKSAAAKPKAEVIKVEESAPKAAEPAKAAVTGAETGAAMDVPKLETTPEEAASFGMESSTPTPAAVQDSVPAATQQAAPPAEEKSEAPKGCVVGMQKVSNSYEIKTEEFQRFQKRSTSKLKSFFDEVDRLNAELAQAETDLKTAEGNKDKKKAKEFKGTVKGLKKSSAASKKQVRQQCLMLIDEMSELGEKHIAEFETTYKEAVKYIKSNSEYEGHAGH